MRSIKSKEKTKMCFGIAHEGYYKGGLNMFYQGSIFQRSFNYILNLVNNAKIHFVFLFKL